MKFEDISLARHRGQNFLVSKKEILGSLAKYAVIQSPYLPENLEKILTAVSTGLDDYFNEPLINVTDGELIDIIEPLLKSIPEFTEWNLSKIQREKGEKYDPNNKDFAFVSRYSDIADENDFVDLDALIRNIVNACHREHLITQSI